MKEDSYYLMLDGLKKIPGYPIYFDYVIDWDRTGWENSCITNCKEEVVEIRVKNPKIEFDFRVSANNYFFSTQLWEIICDYRTLEFDKKEIKFYGKNYKKISSKDYVVICFTNAFDKSNDYHKWLESSYIIPKQEYSNYAELIKPVIDYKVLKEYDITTSNLQGHRNDLVVSESFMKDIRLKNMNLEFIPIEDASKILLYRENTYKIKYGLKDSSEFEELELIKGKKLQEMKLNGKKISFG